LIEREGRGGDRKRKEEKRIVRERRGKDRRERRGKDRKRKEAERIVKDRKGKGAGEGEEGWEGKAEYNIRSRVQAMEQVKVETRETLELGRK
jgi:hypothetical protein